MGRKDRDRRNSKTFEQQAHEEQIGLLAEFWYFLLHNKKWWITPIVLVLLAFGLLIALSSSPAAPFIYAIF